MVTFLPIMVFDEVLFGTIEDNRKDFLASKKAFVDSVVASRTDGTPVQLPPTEIAHSDWSFGHRTRSMKNIKSDRQVESLADDLASWNGIARSEALKLIRDAQKLNNRADSLAGLFTHTPNVPQTMKYAFVDIETTGLSHTTGDILEIAILVTDHEGNTVDKFEELFGVENIAYAEQFGIGTEIHGIELDTIRNLEPFSRSEHAHTVANLLNDPNTIMVSHNKKFENSWFVHYVPDFYVRHARSNPNLSEADKDGLCPEIDTQTLTFMLTDSPQCRLVDLVERMGGEYVNAHRAMNDVIMMKDAYFKLFNMHTVAN